MRYLTTILMTAALVLTALTALMVTNNPDLPYAAGLDIVTGNININGDAALASSPYLRGGSGTSNNPYIISDYDMGAYQLRIDNTVSVLIIRNISFSGSTSTALYFSNSRNILIDNVSCSGRASFIYSSNCRDITLSRAYVSNVQSGTNLVDVRNPSRFTIKDSNFTRSSPGSTPIISFNDQGSGKVILRSYFDNIPIDLQGAGTTAKVDNSTFIDSRLTIRGGDSGTVISGNTFVSSSDRGLFIYTTYRARIASNAFMVKGNGIYFYQMTYQTSNVYGLIENNTFESCTYGINTENNYATCRLSKYEMKHNYFGNCTNFAIDLNWGQDNRIWRNIFYHNKGTSDAGSEAQCEQTVWGGSNNQWTFNGEGNFWANHRTPDNDNDGFVDVNYTIPNNGLDTRPYTNPYLDSERPYLALLEPLSQNPDRSYIVVRWSAKDGVSGLKKVEFAYDGVPYRDVTGQSGTSIWLEKGSHKLRLRATDRAGLYTQLQRDLTLASTYQDLFIEYPEEGAHVPTAAVSLAWKVRNILVPINLSLEMDGIRTYEDPNLRDRTYNLQEGPHMATLRIRDAYGLELKRTVNFTVDVTSPLIESVHPSPGSTLSLNIITFSFNVSDNIALERTEMSLDGSIWAPVQQADRHKVSVEGGDHTFVIRALDKAGNQNIYTVPFAVGLPSDLHIIAPLNGTVTAEDIIPLEWEYRGPFKYSKTLLRVGRSGLYKPTLPSGKVNVPIEDEGVIELSVRLEDELGNYLEKGVEVVRDITDPRVTFISPSAGQYISDGSVSLEWSAYDGPLGGSSLIYELSIDNGPFIYIGESTSYSATLAEGQHRAKVRAYDRANNSGEDEVTFYVDRTAPSVRFTAPLNGSFLKDIQVDIRWEASDNMLLENLTLFLDGILFGEVIESQYLPLPISQNGKHHLRLVAKDMAGLSSEAVTTFFIDTQPPLLSWTGVPPGISRHRTLYLAWSIEEKVGLAQLKLVIGNNTLVLPKDSINATITLEEGSYDVFYLSATDLAGMESRLPAPGKVVIDLTPPTISIDKSRSQVKGFKAVVYWLSSDDLSGISSTSVSLDGRNTVNIESGNFHTFNDISPGAHSILVMVKDRAGNEAESFWNFTVSKQGGGGDDVEDDGIGLNMILLAAVIVAVMVTVVLFLIYRARRREAAIEGENNDIRRGPSKLTLSIPAPASQQGLPRPDLSGLPPAEGAAVKRTEQREDGTGYIRPSRPKKERRRQKGPAEEDPDSIDDRSPSVPLEGALERTPTMTSPLGPEEASFMVKGADEGPGREVEVGSLEDRYPEAQAEGRPQTEVEDSGLEEVEELEEIEELEELEELGDVDRPEEDDIEEWTT